MAGIETDVSAEIPKLMRPVEDHGPAIQVLILYFLGQVRGERRYARGTVALIPSIDARRPRNVDTIASPSDRYVTFLSESLPRKSRSLASAYCPSWHVGSAEWSHESATPLWRYWSSAPRVVGKITEIVAGKKVKNPSPKEKQDEVQESNEMVEKVLVPAVRSHRIGR